ncbi:MAG: matrixin family metalloprotease [Chloroflexi bacterium]|nr:matrixin family metalloprotease [Chloroflexota bacterium]
MRTPLRRVALALALLLPTIAAVSASPASANHEWRYGHWYRTAASGYSWIPVYDRNVTFRNGESMSADAAWVWRDASWGRVNPYLAAHGGGGGAWDCSARDWAIVICVGDPRDLAGNRIDEATWCHWFDGNPNHIQWCVITLNAYTTMSDLRLRAVLRHGMGHAVGLHHNDSTNSVMYSSAPTIYPNAHDTWALGDMYRDHWH